MKVLNNSVLLATVLSPTLTLAFAPSSLSLSRLSTSIMASSIANTCPKTGNPLPNLPLPPPLLSLTPGTWAYDTMSRRLNQEILQRTYEENEEAFTSPEFAEALERFNELRAELDNAADTKLSYLKFDEKEDGRSGEVVEREQREWKEIMGPFVENGDTWLSAPWLVTEVRAQATLMYECTCCLF